MKHVTDLLHLYVSGELDGPRMEAVEEHLRNCPACRTEADQNRRLWGDLAAMETSPELDSVWSAVQARTFGRGKPPREWFFGSGQLARIALATTAVAAGLTLGFLMPSQQESQGVDDDSDTASSWLSDSSWLSQSSWLGGDDVPGIDDLLLGVELQDEVDGS
jgi:anti-sigma factor RsiW